jgi:hypothetical protein
MTPEERAQNLANEYLAVGPDTNRADMPILRGMVKRAIRAAVEEEREACAEVVRSASKAWPASWQEGYPTHDYDFDSIAERIRARGKNE